MRVVFVTREPILHQFGGSTTAALNLLDVLVAHGCEVDLLVTSAQSRSPRLFWKQRIPLPAEVTLHTPGYIGIGPWHIAPFSLRAWARFALRLATRSTALKPLAALVHLAYKQKIVADAWDLTPAEPRETTPALRFLQQSRPEAVVTNYAFWAPLLAAIDGTKIRRILLMHDMLSARVARFELAGIPLDCAPITHAREIAWLNQADIVLAIQSAEAEAIRPLLQAEVLVQPIVLPLSPSSTTPNPSHCLFIGTRIQPNQTGIQWFLDRVWPQIRTQNPLATLTIAGSVCEVLATPPPGVTLAGTVPSLEPEFAAAAVCIVPLLVGSGLKIKLLEALAHGKATVSTPIGVQGLEHLAPGVISVATTPEDFAHSVLELLSNPNRRQTREQAALNLVRQNFRPDSEAATAFAARLLHPLITRHSERSEESQ